ncbi:hypothetical protein [Yersinia rochesterensis]|nr:hypothetical protein [Yersinia rochesterensis]
MLRLIEKRGALEKMRKVRNPVIRFSAMSLLLAGPTGQQDS